jgi:hypothetical protein
MRRFGVALLLVCQAAIWVPLASSAGAGTSLPVFVSPSSTTFVEGSPGLFNVAIAETKKPVVVANFSWSGKIPAGLTFLNNGDGSTATVAGTPAVGSAGTYSLTVSAVNGAGGRAQQHLVITVVAIAPDVPIVTGVSSDSGLANGVTISGRNLSQVTSVMFGALPSPAFKPDVSGTSITAAVPAGAPGAVNVTVTSKAGTSPISVDDVFAYQVAPQMPSIVSVRPEGLSILVTWVPNATSDVVTSYAVSASVTSDYAAGAGSACQPSTSTIVPSTATSVLLATDICIHTPYTVALTATNAWGTSEAGVSPATVVPLDAQAPSAILIQSVHARSHSLIVNWTSPAYDGGSPVTGYTLTTSLRGKVVSTMTLGAAALGGTVAGLQNGARYRVAVVANSEVGSSGTVSDVGTPSPSVPPEVPSGLRVVPDGSGHIVATWAAPFDGGSQKITAYVVKYWRTPGPVRPVTLRVSAASMSVKLSGLDSMNYYFVSVAAASSVGSGRAIVSTEAVTPTVKLAAAAQVLSSSVMENLLSSSPDSAGTGQILLWPGSTKFERPLRSGAVLIGGVSSAAPDGLLVQVQTVATTNAGDIEVDATPASASQAFVIVSFSSSGVPALSGTPSSPGALARRASHSSASTLGDPLINVNWTSSNGALSVVGPVSFTPHVSVSASFHCHHWWSCQMNAMASASLSPIIENLTITLQGSGSIPVYQLPLTPIVFSVGPVLIVILPKIDVNLDYSGSLAFTSNASATVAGSIAWDSSSGFSTSHSTSLGATGSPTASLVASGHTDIQLEFELCLYAVLCGNIQANSNLDVTVAIPGPPYFNICPSESIDVGLSIDLIVWSTSSEITLATLTPTPPCWDILAPPPTLTIVPVPPLPLIGIPLGHDVQLFTATRTDGATPSNTWTLQNSIAPFFPPNAVGDLITSSGSLTTCCVGYRQLIIKDVDSSTPSVIGPATLTVFVGNYVAFDPPGALTFTPLGYLVPVHRLHIYAAKISWTAPVNTGGGPSLLTYNVTVNGTNYTTTATSLVVPDNTPFMVFQVQVLAVNGFGAVSPPANWP